MANRYLRKIEFDHLKKFLKTKNKKIWPSKNFSRPWLIKFGFLKTFQDKG